MTDWVSPQEAVQYLGVRPEDLARILRENDIDVELDDAGVVLAIDASDLREPLFEEHRKKVGHRPDDPKHVDRAQKEHEEHQQKAKQDRKAKRVRLAKRMSVPHE
jgi:hypothetical protein